MTLWAATLLSLHLATKKHGLVLGRWVVLVVDGTWIM